MPGRIFAVFLAALAVHATSALGGEFSLGLPVSCVYGKTCWITKHVDHDLGPGVRDFACGRLADDTHNGVDFALRDEVEMAKGVEVLAAAAGTVNRVRDGAADVNVRIGGKDRVEKMECGNGVLIDHGGGWQTQYCHLRMGSLAVSSGMKVEEGQKLAKKQGELQKLVKDKNAKIEELEFQIKKSEEATAAAAQKELEAANAAEAAKMAEAAEIAKAEKELRARFASLDSRLAAVFQAANRKRKTVERKFYCAMPDGKELVMCAEVPRKSARKSTRKNK